MARRKEIRLKKIPLRPFIEMLMEVYDKGLDYVDLVGTPDYVQDFVGVEFTTDYFCSGERKPEDMFIEQEEGYDEIPPLFPKQDHKLMQDELDQLSEL